jgi:hypothetical protein
MKRSALLNLLIALLTLAIRAIRFTCRRHWSYRPGIICSR